MTLFNVTSSYNRKSNYPITTQWLQCVDWLQDSEFLVSLADKNKLRRQGMAPILFLHSDCGVPSDRDQFVKMLQKYIKIDSYGTCLRNKKLPERYFIIIQLHIFQIVKKTIPDVFLTVSQIFIMLGEK